MSTHIKAQPKKIGFSSLNTATNIFQVFSDISHNFSSKHLGKLLTNSLLSTNKNTHPRPPSQLTPVHTYTNFWANTHKLPLSRSHTHTSRRRGSLRQWGTWQWEVIEKALERCQCITIISPVDPTEIQAQSAVAETHTHMHARAHAYTHTHTHSLGGVRNCVCVCLYSWQEVALGLVLVEMYLHRHTWTEHIYSPGCPLISRSLLRVCALTLGLMLV